jgi:DNA-binding CsgD family transcriptional regulator
MIAEKTLSALIEKIYDAGLDDGRWNSPMEEVRSLIGAETFHLHVRDEKKGSVQSIATNFSESFQTKYTEYWWQFDPRMQALLKAPVGRVHLGSNLLATSNYLRSPIYNELARQEGGAVYLMAGVFPTATEEFAAIGFHRNRRQGDFTAQDARRLDLLAPHIVKSLKLRRLADTLHGILGAVATFEQIDKPLFVVDGKARLIKTNAAGDTLLARGEILQCKRSGVLIAARPSITDNFHRLIATASEGPILRAEQPGGDESLVIQAVDGSIIALVVSKLPSTRSVFGGIPPISVLVTVRDPRRRTTAPIALLRKLHGLTETEAAIAAELANGKSVVEISTDRSVRLSTIRWHLKSIFSKTGVARQVELARLIAGYRQA